MWCEINIYIRGILTFFFRRVNNILITRKCGRGMGTFENNNAFSHTGKQWEQRCLHTVLFLWFLNSFSCSCLTSQEQWMVNMCTNCFSIYILQFSHNVWSVSQEVSATFRENVSWLGFIYVHRSNQKYHTGKCRPFAVPRSPPCLTFRRLMSTIVVVPHR